MTVQSAEMRSIGGNGNLAEVAPQTGASERCAECPCVGRVSQDQCHMVIKTFLLDDIHKRFPIVSFDQFGRILSSFELFS